MQSEISINQKGWQSVAQHPKETSSWSGGKWVESISLDKELGADFFHRPAMLQFDARPYTYRPRVGVRKVGPTWQLEIKRTDDHADVGLDRNFKITKVTKNCGSQAVMNAC